MNSNHRDRKGLVTDVSGPQRNACPGTLTHEEGLSSLGVRVSARIFRAGVAGRNRPAEEGGAGRLWPQTGRSHPPQIHNCSSNLAESTHVVIGDSP